MPSKTERTAWALLLATALLGCGGTVPAGPTGAAGTMGAAGTEGGAGTGSAGTMGDGGTTDGRGTTGDGGSCGEEPWFFLQPGVTSTFAAPDSEIQITWMSLDAYCRAYPRGCPPSLEAAKAEIARIKAQAVIVAGCGRHALETRMGVIEGWLWIFDDATGGLIGAASYNDTTTQVEGCGALANFEAGEGPPLPEGTDPRLAGAHRKICGGVTVSPL